VVALQVLALLGLAGWREFSLRTGREVVLQTVPVDPRDLFRGDYVVLRYTISALKTSRAFRSGDTVYVRLARQGDVWEAVDVAAAPPEDRNQVFLRGRVARELYRFDRNGPGYEVEYGIESYFVPEGTGRRLERARSALRVRVVIDRDGNAQIEGIEPD
jgi:uncharacterized membrane-anchored protein